VDAPEFVAYLEDHLAGSEAGLSIARRLRRRHAGSEVGASMEDLIDDIGSDQQVLRETIAVLRGSVAAPSVLSRAVGAATSVAAWVRRSLPQRVPSLLEDLEALAIGVWGKRLLWGALARQATVDPRLEGFPFEVLAARAEEQERLLLRLRDEALQQPSV
jgi:hypothetical protein